VKIIVVVTKIVLKFTVTIHSQSSTVTWWCQYCGYSHRVRWQTQQFQHCFQPSANSACEKADVRVYIMFLTQLTKRTGAST